MSIQIADREQTASVVSAVRRANTEALSDPATVARYLDPGFAVRSHTRLISHELAAVASGETKRLLIMVPPQTGKSVLAAMWTPFWWLARNPQHKVIVASYAQHLAVTRGRSVRRMVHEHGWRWGLDTAYGSASVADWELVSGGGLKSVGVGSGVTGFPADLGLCDDPHKDRADADSLTQRERVWDWWSSAFLSRLAPGAPVVMLLTPWHPDDLAHRVIEQDGTTDEGGLWRVLRLPAIAGPDDPLAREAGSPLPHPKIPVADVDASRAHWDGRRASVSVRDWNALYQLDPQPAEGALLDETILRERRHTPPPATPVKHVVAVDPSGGGRDTAGIIGGWLGDDRRLYYSDDATVTGPSDQWARAACLLAADLDADTIVIEANYGGDMAKTVIRSAWDTLAREHPDDRRFQRLAPQVKLVHARKGKLLRAEPIAQAIGEDRVRLAAHLPELVHEWSHWQPTDPDSPGRIDASVHLALHLLPIPGSDTLVSTPTGLSRQSVGPRSGGARIRRAPPGGRRG